MLDCVSPLIVRLPERGACLKGPFLLSGVVMPGIVREPDWEELVQGSTTIASSIRSDGLTTDLLKVGFSGGVTTMILNCPHLSGDRSCLSCEGMPSLLSKRQTLLSSKTVRCRMPEELLLRNSNKERCSNQ